MDIYLGLLSPKKLVSKEEGREVLDLLGSVYPDLLPEYYGYCEPILTKYDSAHPEEALEGWGNTFLWKRKRPKLQGFAFSAWAPMPLYGSLDISIDAAKADIARLLEYFQEAAIHLDVDFAYLHPLTTFDIDRGGADDTIFCLDPKRREYNLVVATQDMVKYVPDLYWATVLGPPYIQHFGRERLLSAPAHAVYPLGDNQICIQLSENPLDMATNFTELDAIRRDVKQHLNQNSFYDPMLPDDHIYSVPELRIGAS